MFNQLPKKINLFQVATTLSFISNYGQASDLKVAYIFKAFGAQSCLMVA